MGRVKVYLAPVEGEMKVGEIEDSVEGMQGAVGGYVQSVAVGSMLFLYCDEDAGMKNLPPNPRITGILGDAFFARIDEDGNLRDLSDNDVIYIKGVFK